MLTNLGRMQNVVEMIKELFYGAIKGSVFLFFPFIWVYNRFFTNAVDDAVGYYWKMQIKHKGKDLRIHGKIKILDAGKLVIGNYCRIGKGAFLFCKGGLTIGNNVQFSRNITVYTANHNFKSDVLPYNSEYLLDPVIINDNVWIGMNVSILPGVVIGKNSILGMNAVITKDVPENAIVVGNNRIIGYRSEAQINESKGNFFGKLYPNA